MGSQSSGGLGPGAHFPLTRLLFFAVRGTFSDADTDVSRAQAYCRVLRMHSSELRFASDIIGSPTIVRAWS